MGPRFGVTIPDPYTRSLNFFITSPELVYVHAGMLERSVL